MFFQYPFSSAVLLTYKLNFQAEITFYGSAQKLYIVNGFINIF